jgi:hypothetical protein
MSLSPPGGGLKHARRAIAPHGFAPVASGPSPLTGLERGAMDRRSLRKPQLGRGSTARVAAERRPGSWNRVGRIAKPQPGRPRQDKKTDVLTGANGGNRGGTAFLRYLLFNDSLSVFLLWQLRMVTRPRSPPSPNSAIGADLRQGERIRCGPAFRRSDPHAKRIAALQASSGIRGGLKPGPALRSDPGCRMPPALGLSRPLLPSGAM